MLLENKVAIVSGIGPGMGRDISLAFAREGAKLALAARSPGKLEKALAEVRAAGAEAIAVPTDITQPDDCARLVAAAQSAFGRVDVLVNNAFHQGTFSPVESADLDEVARALRGERARHAAAHAAGDPADEKQGGGSIVMINSMVIRDVLPTMADYAASKAALMAATQGLARELGPSKIRVNSVVPGYIWGPSLQWYFGDLAKQRGITPQQVYDEVAADTALRHLPTSEEIAAGGRVLRLGPLARDHRTVARRERRTRLQVTGRFAARRAVVTGGASGIGLATCRRLAAEGARVAILDVQKDLAQAAAASSAGSPSRPTSATPRPSRRAMQAAARELGGIDLLFNNAGAGAVRTLHRYTPEDVERLVRVNLFGVYNGLRAAIPLMLAGGGGAIVNNASASATQPVRGEAPYAAAKAGVLALTQSAALEYGPHIRVNSVSPGMIRTPMSEGLFRAPGLLDPVIAATPLGRTGTVEEVADAVVFLLSEQARFITGHDLVVDGGLGLPGAGIDATIRLLLGRIEKSSNQPRVQRARLRISRATQTRFSEASRERARIFACFLDRDSDTIERPSVVISTRGAQ